MQQVEALAAPPPAAIPAAATVEDPRAFARGLVIGAVVSAPAWMLVAVAVQAVLD